MKLVAIMLALVCACEEGEADTAEVKATKAQCHDVLAHIVTISPQGQGKDAEQVVTALPTEDVQSCVASEPEIRACMLTAADIAAVRKCIPAQPILDCMQAAAKAKKAAHEKAPKDKPVDDKPFDDIRAKCWAGDPNAAKPLTTT